MEDILYSDGCNGNGINILQAESLITFMPNG